MIKGIEHIAIVARDPVKLVKWYEKNLDMKTVRKMSETTFFIQAPCGTVLEIYAAQKEGARDFDNHTSGLRHLAILVEDFDLEYKKLIDNGVEIAAEPVINDEIKLVLFKDCEGNLCHFIERKNPLI